jgi:hypothetical protein
MQEVLFGKWSGSCRLPASLQCRACTPPAGAEKDPVTGEKAWLLALNSRPQNSR